MNLGVQLPYGAGCSLQGTPQKSLPQRLQRQVPPRSSKPLSIMATPEEQNTNQEKDGVHLADFVRLMVLGWSATLLTVSYLNLFPNMKMDSTFIASLLTGAMAGFGIERKAGNQTKKEPPTIKGTPDKGKDAKTSASSDPAGS